MTRKIAALALLAALVALLAGGPAHARRITDMAGRQVEVPEVVTKVYATAPPATYMVYALAPELLAGLNSPMPQAGRQYLDRRVLALPILGGWFGQGRMANLETLLRARPDVVLAFRWRGQRQQWKIEQTLEPLGLPVAWVELGGLEDFPRFFRFLGELCNRRERAEALANHAQRTIDDLARLRKSLGQSDLVSVYYAEGGQGLQTECDDSFHVELIKLCGGVNAHKCQAKTIHGLESVSLEQVLAYDPQVIVTNEAMFAQSLPIDRRWRDVRAVRDGRILQPPAMPFNWFDRPPSFMRLLGAHWLANKLHPQRYAVDMAAKTMEFFRLFLGVELDRATALELLGQ